MLRTKYILKRENNTERKESETNGFFIVQHAPESGAKESEQAEKQKNGAVRFG